MCNCFIVDDLRLEIIFSRLTGELLFAKGTFICICHRAAPNISGNRLQMDTSCRGFHSPNQKNAAFLGCETPIDCCKPAYFSDMLFSKEHINLG